MLYNSLKQIENNTELDIPGSLFSVENKYPVLISDYYLSLIDKTKRTEDPIWKLCMPDEKELKDADSSFDPLYEEIQMPVPKLIHRYKNRAVLLATNKCSTQCRFCFRKRYWRYGINKHEISDTELAHIIQYLLTHAEINEILLSGGDPLMLDNNRLKYILDELYSVKSIKIVRIATRIPVTLPCRIDSKLAELLSKYEGIWFITHFNHPNEITDKSLKACKQITSAGIPILNQTVLLKGINDTPEILEELFNTLAGHHIKPHYLFHVDPVRGVKHFATGIKKGLEILEYFRENVSSIATPHFAIDLPKGGGKISLQPDYFTNGKYRSINSDETVEYYPELD